MTTSLQHSRRHFIASLFGGAAGLLLCGSDRAVQALSGGVSLFFYDPLRSEARRCAASATAHGCVTAAIVGDRIRLARQWLKPGAAAPEVIMGLSDYADFILLSGSAAEVGYRVENERPIPSSASGGRRSVLMYWSAAQRRPIVIGADSTGSVGGGHG